MARRCRHCHRHQHQHLHRHLGCLRFCSVEPSTGQAVLIASRACVTYSGHKGPAGSGPLSLLCLPPRSLSSHSDFLAAFRYSRHAVTSGPLHRLLCPTSPPAYPLVHPLQVPAQNCLLGGGGGGGCAWVAQLAKCPTLAQVISSQLVGWNPASGSVLTAQSPEPASDSVSPSLPLSLPLPSRTLSLSLKNK